MSQKQQDNSIDDLAALAGEKVHRERARAESMMARGSGKPRSYMKFVAALLAVLVLVAAWIQIPKILNPFGIPVAGSAAIVEADLTVIADFIAIYRVAQGRYPTTLDEVNLPDALRAAVTESKITYQLTADSFVLVSLLPPQKIEFDGATGLYKLTDAK